MEEGHLVGIEIGMVEMIMVRVVQMAVLVNTGNELEERWKKDRRFVEEFLPYLLKKR